MRLTDFDVLTFDMIGTLIDFEQGVAARFDVAVEPADAPAVVRSARHWPAFADSAMASPATSARSRRRGSLRPTFWP